MLNLTKIIKDKKVKHKIIQENKFRFFQLKKKKVKNNRKTHN